MHKCLFTSWGEGGLITWRKKAKFSINLPKLLVISINYNMSSKLVARFLNKSECTSISVFPIYQKLNHHLRHKFLFKVLFQNTLYIRDLPLLRKVAKNVTIYFNLSEPPNMFVSFRYIKWSAYPLKLAPTICLTKIQYLDRHLWLLQAFK